MSPLGSMTMDGIPSMAASSMSAMPRPVLPLPVMPMHIAWVVKSDASSRYGASTFSPVAGSTGRPR